MLGHQWFPFGFFIFIQLEYFRSFPRIFWTCRSRELTTWIRTTSRVAIKLILKSTRAVLRRMSTFCVLATLFVRREWVALFVRREWVTLLVRREWVTLFVRREWINKLSTADSGSYMCDQQQNEFPFCHFRAFTFCLPCSYTHLASTMVPSHTSDL